MQVLSGDGTLGFRCHRCPRQNLVCWECKPKIERTTMSAAEAQSPLWFISHWCGPCASSVVHVFCRYVLWARQVWMGPAATRVVGPSQYGISARPLLVLWARPVWIGPAATCVVGPAVMDAPGRYRL